MKLNKSELNKMSNVRHADPLNDSKGAWREAIISVDTPEGVVNVEAGEVVDILRGRVKVAESLSKCMLD